MSLRFRCAECGATTTLPESRGDRRNFGLKYSLEGAPAGMNIAADGTLTWKAPADVHAEVRVAIRVQSSNGESVHGFVLTRN